MSSSQKRLAAKVLKCGVNRVWISPKSEKVKTAITRSDIRRFIDDGVIKKLPVKKNIRKIKKRQQKRGSIKGKAGARERKKEGWLRSVRPQRKLLKELKDGKKLKPNAYRKIYRMIKGGSFRSRHHLNLYLKEKGHLVE